MSWIWLIITGLLAFGDCCATAQVRGPFELPGSLRRFRFPQTFIADCALPLPRRSAPLTMVKSYAVGKVTVNVSDSILVAGRDEHGEAWDLVVDSSPGGCWLWRSDLDRNGREDLIILVSDAGSGGETVLTLIMIDALGRPVPWQAVGRFEPDTRGLRNLVDMNRDGRAELLYFYVEGYDRGEARAMSITSYEIKDAHLERRDGRRGGSAFQLFGPPAPG